MAACYEHKPRMDDFSRPQKLLDQLFTHFIEAEGEIVAWVVLGNHYHLLVKNVEFKHTSPIFQLIHGRFARH